MNRKVKIKMKIFFAEKNYRILISCVFALAIALFGATTIVLSHNGGFNNIIDISSILDVDETCAISISECSMTGTRRYDIKGNDIIQVKSAFVNSTFIPKPSWNAGQERISCPTFYDFEVETKNGEVIKMQYVSYGYLTVEKYFNGCPLRVEDGFFQRINQIMKRNTVYIESGLFI